MEAHCRWGYGCAGLERWSRTAITTPPSAVTRSMHSSTWLSLNSRVLGCSGLAGVGTANMELSGVVQIAVAAVLAFAAPLAGREAPGRGSSGDSRAQMPKQLRNFWHALAHALVGTRGGLHCRSSHERLSRLYQGQQAGLQYIRRHFVQRVHTPPCHPSRETCPQHRVVLQRYRLGKQA